MSQLYPLSILTLCAFLSLCNSWSGLLINGGKGTQLYNPYAHPPGMNVTGFGLNKVRFGAAATLGHYSYFFGGYDGKALDTTMMFNARSNGTEPGPLLPHASYGMCATKFNDTSILLCGGYNADNRPQKDCFMMSADNVLQPVADYPIAVAYCTMVVLDVRVYVFGGRLENKQPTNEAYHYDGATNKWIGAQSMPYALYWHGAAAMDSTTAMICGGRNGTSYTKSCFKYSAWSDDYKATLDMNYSEGIEYVMHMGNRTWVFHQKITEVEVYDGSQGWQSVPKNSGMAFGMYDAAMTWVTDSG